MSRPAAPDPAKLIVGLLIAPAADLGRGLNLLEEAFGPADFISEATPFVASDYYAPEMGPHLTRRWLSHRDLVHPDRLAEIKLLTNQMERDLARPDGARTLNLDPGLLSLERLVLATGKNNRHRVYLSQGIYADLTLIFDRGRFTPLPWTYPDYAAGSLPNILIKIRNRYRDQLKEAA